jgi:hypothetical protein
MYILEAVIVGLVVLLLYSTGWLYRIFQLFISRLVDFGRAFLAALIQEQIKPSEGRKKFKKTK